MWHTNNKSTVLIVSISMLQFLSEGPGSFGRTVKNQYDVGETVA